MQPGRTSSSAMRRSIIHNPKDPSGLGVRRLGHDLVDKPSKGSHPGLGLASTKQLGSVDIPGRQISPSPQTSIFVFYSHRQSRLRRKCWVATCPRLNAGFLVGRQHKLVRAQRLALPDAMIEIQDAPRLGRKIRIAWKDPATVLPGPDGILVKPAPYRAVTNGSDQAGSTRLCSDLGDTPARQGLLATRRQLTGERLDLDDDLWGEKPGAVPSAGLLPAPPDVSQRIASATSRRPLGDYPNDERFHRSRDLEPRAESSWRARPENTVTYISGRVPTIPALLQARERSDMGSDVAFCSSIATQNATTNSQTQLLNTLVYL